MTHRTPPRELLGLSPRAANLRRWAEGRERHGDRWQGEHPLYEAYVEVVDLGVYLDVAEAMGAVARRDAELARALCWPLIDQIRGLVVGLESQEGRPLQTVPSTGVIDLSVAGYRRWRRPSDALVMEAVVNALSGHAGEQLP